MLFFKNFSLGLFIDKFFKDSTTTLAASLAFYTALSLAPLLIIFVAVCSSLSLELQDVFLARAQELVGFEGVVALQMVIEAAKNRSDLSTGAGLLGAAFLLFSAGVIFGELRFALNKIFARKEEFAVEGSVLWQLIHFARDRMIYAFIALLFIVAMTVSLFLLSFKVSSWLTPLFSLVYYTLFFGMLFRYIPHPKIPWPRVIHGAVLTTILFIVGKYAIEFYITQSALGSAYGAAGSLIVLMIWIYYSSLITLCGAQLSASLKLREKRRRLEESHV